MAVREALGVLIANRRSDAMLQIAFGIMMAFAIGAACRWFDIPSPAPPKVVGALLVIAMTIGFLLTDRLLGAG
jgi:XapX domain-containing protein